MPNPKKFTNILWLFFSFEVIIHTGLLKGVSKALNVLAFPSFSLEDDLEET
jgi:hypothetical protein